jgi:hypothetical protein
MEFNFKYAVGFSNYSDGGFVLNFGNFELNINEQKNGIDIQFQNKVLNYLIKNIDDKDNRDLVLKALNDKFYSQSFDRIIVAMGNGIGNYYISKIYDNPSFILNTQYPSQKIQIDTNKYIGICKRVNDTVLCPYSGNISDPLTSDLYSDSLIENSFTSNTNEYKVFVHYKLFNDIFQNLIKNELFNFALTNDNKPQNLPYNLNIQSLGDIFSDLYDNYSRTFSLKVKNKISFLNISNEDSNNFANGKFTLNSSIVIDNEAMDEVVKFSADINFKIKAETLGSKLNFCVSSLNLMSLQFLTESRTSLIGTFKYWVSTTLDKYIASNRYCISRDEINLNEYFKYISSVIQGKRGFYIVGKSLYLINNAENRENLKFLE